MISEVAKYHIMERNAVCCRLLDKLAVHIEWHRVLEDAAVSEGLCSTLGFTETR
jgi:hypothetical protein